MLKDLDEMQRCEFNFILPYALSVCLDRIRTQRYFSVSPMSADEGCSNKSLSRFLKDTVTKEMTGSRSSIIYPHRPSSAIPLLLSAAYITSIHAHLHAYDNHTPQVAPQSWVQAQLCRFPNLTLLKRQPLCHRDVWSAISLTAGWQARNLKATKLQAQHVIKETKKIRAHQGSYLLGKTKGWR